VPAWDLFVQCEVPTEDSFSFDASTPVSRKENVRLPTNRKGIINVNTLMSRDHENSRYCRALWIASPEYLFAKGERNMGLKHVALFCFGRRFPSACLV
jgi:hypothetical protein